MIVKLKHTATHLPQSIETEHDDPDKNVRAKLGGLLHELLHQELVESYGHYGRIVDPDSTTNLDLVAAAQDLLSFTFEESTPKTNLIHYLKAR